MSIFSEEVAWILLRRCYRKYKVKEDVFLVLENHSVNDGRWIQAQKQEFNSSVSGTTKLLEESGIDGSGGGRLVIMSKTFFFKKINLLALCGKI